MPLVAAAVIGRDGLERFDVGHDLPRTLHHSFAISKDIEHLMHVHEEEDTCTSKE
jgi:hypothetical protein